MDEFLWNTKFEIILKKQNYCDTWDLKHFHIV
jgi:hypothetical protein